MSFWSSIFGSNKTISVTSTVYNLAGNELTRPNFLKTSVIGAVFNKNDLSLGKNINNSYLTGPGIKLRSFARWSKNSGYSALVGMAATPIYMISDVDPDVVTSQLPTIGGATTVLQNSRIGQADFVFWVSQYMTNHHPDLMDTDYTCDYYAPTETVTITLVGGAVETFTIPGFNPAAQFLYATYVFSTPGTGTPPGPATESALQYYAYQKNSGNATLDALFVPSGEGGYFIPYIPIRINKVFLAPTVLTPIYNSSIKAVKKSLGGKYTDIIKKLETNPSISNIDFAYIVFGVSLNVKENACRKYVYLFFSDAMLSVAPGHTNYSIVVSSPGVSFINYNITINWDSIAETFGVGLRAHDGITAKAGDLWFESSFGSIKLYWQTSDTVWKCLTITNLVHLNFIYGGNAVKTTGADALAASTESGFIIPLNAGIYASMPLVDSTQMATACCFLVCNAYAIHTTPWYATGFFKVLLIVVVIAVTALTAGLGGVGGVGLLGSDLAVGTALGLTATSAIIVGSLANSIAAIILVQVIQTVSNSVFGAQFGAIVGAIASLLTLQIGAALANGESVSSLLNAFTQPMNLLKLTEAAGNGYAGVMQGQAQSINASTQKMIKEYDVASTNLKKLYEDTFGNSGVDLSVNPMSLVDVALPGSTQNVALMESPDSFLNRTLLLGSDICELSMSYVNDFCDAGLSTKLPNSALT